MQKNQTIKHKKKDPDNHKPKSSKNIQHFKYQTSHKNYTITVNAQHSKNDTSHKHLSTHNKNNKKSKFIVESISKSNWLPTLKEHGSHKNLTLKVSSLNNIEDLNIYQKPKSGKRSRKGSLNDPLEQQIRHNAKFAQQNVHIKARDVKSQSRSVKKMNLKAITLKQKQKCKSSKSLKPKTPKVNKSKSKETFEKTAEMMEIQNSYYFENYSSKKESDIEGSTKLRQPKTRQTNSPQNRKQNMFLFESKEEEWQKPKKRYSNLEGTVDLMN